MRVEGPNRIGQGTQGARRTSSGSGFSLPETESQAPAAKPTGPMAAPGLDALLALQSVDMPLERRKKAAARGRQMLDLLDSVKLGVLDGTLSHTTLENLKSALAGREPTDDPGLEAIMDEISLRAEVELAKLTRQTG
jgi:hypothetical protein